MNEGKYDVNYKLVTEKEKNADISEHIKTQPRPKIFNAPLCLQNGM